MEYCLHSTVRSLKTRTLRATQPTHVRRTQFVLDTQRRLVPGRPTVISEEELSRNLETLKQLERDGVLEVKLPTGEPVDLLHLAPKQKTPDPKLHPERLPDSAHNDLPIGRTFRKLDLSNELAVDPLARPEILSKEPVPAPLPPPVKEGHIVPALPPNAPYVPKKKIEAKASEEQPASTNMFGGPSLEDLADVDADEVEYVEKKSRR